MTIVRLKNISTGAIVSVREEKVAALGNGWEPADKPAEPVKRGPGRPKKSDN